MTSACQQFELYSAEAGLPRGREFGSARELQEWVDGLRERPWWDRFFPHVLRVEAHFVEGPDSAGAWEPHRSAGVIEMGLHHRCESFTIHELAHVLANARHGDRCGHSPWFARTYLELTHLITGPEAFKLLRDAFDADGVQHEPPLQDFEVGSVRLAMRLGAGCS